MQVKNVGRAPLTIGRKTIAAGATESLTAVEAKNAGVQGWLKSGALVEARAEKSEK